MIAQVYKGEAIGPALLKTIPTVYAGLLANFKHSLFVDNYLEGLTEKGLFSTKKLGANTKRKGQTFPTRQLNVPGVWAETDVFNENTLYVFAQNLIQSTEDMLSDIAGVNRILVDKSMHHSVDGYYEIQGSDVKSWYLMLRTAYCEVPKKNEPLLITRPAATWETVSYIKGNE